MPTYTRAASSTSLALNLQSPLMSPSTPAVQPSHSLNWRAGRRHDLLYGGTAASARSLLPLVLNSA